MKKNRERINGSERDFLRGANSSYWAQEEWGPCWPSRSHALHWLGSMVFLHWWPMDLVSWHLVGWIVRTYGGPLVCVRARSWKGKIYEEIGGPGIRTQVLKQLPCTPLPLRQLFLFVHIIQNINQIWKRLNTIIQLAFFQIGQWLLASWSSSSLHHW